MSFAEQYRAMVKEVADLHRVRYFVRVGDHYVGAGASHHWVLRQEDAAVFADAVLAHQFAQQGLGMEMGEYEIGRI